MCSSVTNSLLYVAVRCCPIQQQPGLNHTPLGARNPQQGRQPPHIHCSPASRYFQHYGHGIRFHSLADIGRKWIANGTSLQITAALNSHSMANTCPHYERAFRRAQGASGRMWAARPLTARRWPLPTRPCPTAPLTPS